MERQHIQYDPELIGFRDHADRRYYYHTRTLLRIDFYAESVKNAEKKRHFYNRFFQKKRYKDAYRAARAGKSVGSLGGATTIAGVKNMTVKAKIALKEIIKRNRAMFAGIGIFALLFLVIAVSLGSCSASIEGAGSVIGITTYPSSDEDIYAAENQYAALESALNQQINEMERRHPNYDEYQYKYVTVRVLNSYG